MDEEEWGIRLFCAVGKHPSEIVGRVGDKVVVMPHGWRLVPARRDALGKLVFDPTSLSKLIVCPAHRMPGEPGRDA